MPVSIRPTTTCGETSREADAGADDTEDYGRMSAEVHMEVTGCICAHLKEVTRRFSGVSLKFVRLKYLQES